MDALGRVTIFVSQSDFVYDLGTVWNQGVAPYSEAYTRTRVETGGDSVIHFDGSYEHDDANDAVWEPKRCLNYEMQQYISGKVSRMGRGG